MNKTAKIDFEKLKGLLYKPGLMDRYGSQITGGIGGSLLGAGALGGATALFGGDPSQDKEEKRKSVYRNLLLGGILGGVGGVGLATLRDAYNGPPPKEQKRSLFGLAKDMVFSKPMAGATGINLATGLARQANSSNNGIGSLTGGVKMTDLQKQLETDVADALTIPKGRFLSNIQTNPDMVAQLNARVKQMTGSNTLLGRLSQNSLLRMLGLDLTPAGGERAVATALAPLRNKKYLPQILGGTSPKDVPYKDLYNTILNSGGKDSFADPISLSRGRGAIARTLGGAIGLPALSALADKIFSK